MSLRILARNRSPILIAKSRGLLEHFTAKPKAAGGFDYPTLAVGRTAWKGQDGGGVSVYYDPSLGGGGLAVAQNVLSRLDALMSWCDSVFGVQGKSGNVIVAALSGATDGSTGAYHYGCSFNADSPGSDWYEDYAQGNPDEVFGLACAEIVESYMGLQNKGWNCGGSGGEGLSRVLAEIVSGGPSGALVAYASGPSWDGTDWISKDQGTDGDYPSIGCSVLYLWWMLQTYTIGEIAQAGEPDGSLASNYSVLTGKPKTQAFADFAAAVKAAGGPLSDNPFKTPTPPFPPNGGGTPVPPPSPSPPPPVPPSPPPPSPPVPPPVAGPTLAEVEACDQDVFAQLKRTFRRTRGAAQILDAALLALEGEHAALWQLSEALKKSFVGRFKMEALVPVPLSARGLTPSQWATLVEEIAAAVAKVLGGGP